MEELLLGVLQDVLSAGIIAVVSAIVVKRYTSMIAFTNKMKREGFKAVSVNGISQREKRRMFKDAVRVDIINVSGYHFFNDNESQLKKAIEDGAEVRFLCAAPYSEFLNNIEMLENATKIRPKGKLISNEIYDLIEKYKDTKLQISFYTSGYRLPFVLVEYKDGTIKCWLTITLPPYKSTESFVLSGETKDDEEGVFIKMIETHFDTIWNSASVRLEDFQKKVVSKKQEEWEEKYEAARKFMASRDKGNRVLIEVAAQHPLIDGTKPNEEFEGRLKKAIAFMEEHRELECYFYVPGSLHAENGESDKISLSEAGCNYLKKHGVKEKRIYGLKSNIRYKGEDGVFNSTDECYVASHLFKDEKFNQLYCICSPVQMMRKVLSYIEFGVVPQIEVFSCENMYHDYVEEFFRAIPTLVYDANALQGECSVEAKKLRAERR